EQREPGGAWRVFRLRRAVEDDGRPAFADLPEQAEVELLVHVAERDLAEIRPLGLEQVELLQRHGAARRVREHRTAGLGLYACHGACDPLLHREDGALARPELRHYGPRRSAV